MIMIGVFVQAIIDYVSRNNMPVLVRYHDSLHPSDRENWIEPFSRSFFARIVYMILRLPVPPEIEQENHNMELAEQFKSEWEGVFNQVFPMGLNGLNTEKVKTSLLRELAQEKPLRVGEVGSSSETDADSGNEKSQEIDLEINSTDDNGISEEVVKYAFNFTGKQHIERFAQCMFIEVFRIIRGIPGYSCAGCTLPNEDCVCEACEGCHSLNPYGMRHFFCPPQCPKVEQYGQGQIDYDDESSVLFFL